jgi:hypothetical protein
MILSFLLHLPFFFSWFLSKLFNDIMVSKKLVHFLIYKKKLLSWIVKARSPLNLINILSQMISLRTVRNFIFVRILRSGLRK